MCLCRSRSMFGTDEGQPRSDRKMERSSGLDGFRLYSSVQESLGIDGEAIEFEWTNFLGFSSLSFLQEIPKDLARKNVQTEEFDQIIFVAMFNDIDWKKDDEK